MPTLANSSGSLIRRRQNSNRRTAKENKAHVSERVDSSHPSHNAGKKKAEWKERDFWFWPFGCQDTRQLRHSRAGSGGDPLHGLGAEVRRRVTHGGGPPAPARLARAQRLQRQRRASPAQMRCHQRAGRINNPTKDDGLPRAVGFTEGAQPP